MTRIPTTGRLTKMLRLIPILHSNQGITVNELQKIAGFKNHKDLSEALDRLLMFGAPPFSPADFIDIYIDEDGKVFLDSSQGLDRPLALRSEEWRALERVIQKSEQFQTSDTPVLDGTRNLLERISDVPLSMAGSAPYERTRSLIEEALHEKLQLEFLYKSATSRLPEKRRVDPWALFINRGSAYMVGFCHLRKAARMFHLERIDDSAILEMDTETEAPEELREMIHSSPLFQNTNVGFLVELEFEQSLTRSLDYHFGFIETPLRSENSGWLRGKMKVRESIGARTLLRAFGPGLRIVSPEHFRRSFLDELQEIPVPAPI